MTVGAKFLNSLSFTPRTGITVKMGKRMPALSEWERAGARFEPPD